MKFLSLIILLFVFMVMTRSWMLFFMEIKCMCSMTMDECIRFQEEFVVDYEVSL